MTPAKPHHPKDLSALPIIPVGNGIESLIADPRPQSWTKLDANKDELTEDRKSNDHRDIERQLIGDLPVQIMVQSSDVHNNYTVDDHNYESSEEAIVEAVASPATETEAPAINKSDDKEMHSSLELISPQEISTTIRDSFLSTTNREITIPTTTPTTLAIESTSAQTVTESSTVKKLMEDNKARKPSLDKIAESLVERYFNNNEEEDVASYEDLWYDDNGDLLWSAEEELGNNGKNVKRQVNQNNVVRPVPLNQPDPTRQEVERLRNVTDVIDRFRSMLDIAQQVDSYLTKRLQVGINALAAMYNEN